jgi:hypothetical protein
MIFFHFPPAPIPNQIRFGLGFKLDDEKFRSHSTPGVHKWRRHSYTAIKWEDKTDVVLRVNYMKEAFFRCRAPVLTHAWGATVNIA